MTTLYTALAGDYPSAAEFNTLVPLFAHKTADQSLTTTTLTNDSFLFVTVSANVKYHFRLFTYLKAANATNGGMKVMFTFPSGADINDAKFSLGSGTSPGAPTGAGGAVNGITLTTSNVFFEEEGTLVTGANAGTFQFQWAQNGASANASTVASGSFLLLRQVT